MTQRSTPSKINAITAAFIQFSRLPVPVERLGLTLEKSDFDRSAGYLPLVGLVVGLISAAAFVVSNSVLPATVSAVVAIIVSVVITGAIHEDGFADCCDGLFGGYTPEKRLKIMKDSLLGSFGVLGLVLLILLKFTLLSALFEQTAVALVCAHTFARVMPLWIMRQGQYISLQTLQSSGQTSKMTAGMEATSHHAGKASIILLIAALLALPAPLVFTLATALLVATWACKYLFDRKLGGYNGDCLGATEQIGEIIVLLVFAFYY